MMFSAALERKWQYINKESISGYRFIRINSDCTPELNIGYNSHGNRCLILELPYDFIFEINSINKENLSIEHVKESNSIVISLNNESFYDLFNDLIISLYQRIKDLNVPDEYAAEFTQSFSKWLDFFENKIAFKLTKEEILGLFGELFVLNEIINITDADKVNDILESWVGPYDAPQDFHFPQRHIEVKTKLESNSRVTISSEYQLESKSTKELLLYVVNVSVNYEKGYSLYDIVKATIAVVRERMGDLSILYKALNEKQLTISSLKEYNNFRFLALNTSIFDCNQKNFPRIIKSNLPYSVSRVTYYLETKLLDEFLIEVKYY